MEHDTLNDDLVETQIFDLGTLELNKTCQKTFTFREVLQRLTLPFYCQLLFGFLKYYTNLKTNFFEILNLGVKSRRGNEDGTLVRPSFNFNFVH